MIHALAFDMDGTLVSSEDVYIHVGAETLRRRGKDFGDDLRHEMMGRTATEALRVMIDWHDLPDTIGALTEESEQLFWEFAEDELRVLPHAAGLLDWLDAQHDLPRCIVTSGGRRYAERVLELTGLSARFPFLITADEVTRGKPDPEPYRLAAERFGVDAAAMLVLEDSGNGCRSAIDAGAFAVAVPNDHTVGHDFADARLVADSLADPRIKALLAPSAESAEFA